MIVEYTPLSHTPQFAILLFFKQWVEIVDIKVIFGRVLSDARKEKKISQERLALEADLDRSYVSKLETGVYQPSISTLIAIAKVLEIRPGLLVDKVMDELERQ